MLNNIRLMGEVKTRNKNKNSTFTSGYNKNKKNVSLACYYSVNNNYV